MADVTQYDKTKSQLEANRKVFLEGPAQDMVGIHDTVFWIEAAVGNPRLHSSKAGTTTDYGFAPYLTSPSSPNPIDNLNWHASTTMVATANTLDGISTYAVGQPQSSLGKWTLDAPPYGEKWWAYFVDINYVYAAIQDPSGKLHVMRWSTSGATTDMITIEDAIAPNQLGEFIDLAVDGNTLMFDEGGRIWMADLTTKVAKWVKNDQEIGAAEFDASGAYYTQGKDIYHFDLASNTREKLTDKIIAGYTMNKTFTQIHVPDGQFTHRGSTLIYKGGSGIFSYDMTTGKTTPLLLDSRDNAVTYRNPVVLDDGTLFVKGLESNDGAIGADGPTFKVGL